MRVWEGSISYTDEDEDFLNGLENETELSGIVVLRLNQNEFTDLLVKLSKVDPVWANEHIVNEFYNANLGFCCEIEYHSNKKTEICVNCGKIVNLT